MDYYRSNLIPLLMTTLRCLMSAITSARSPARFLFLGQTTLLPLNQSFLTGCGLNLFSLWLLPLHMPFTLSLTNPSDVVWMTESKEGRLPLGLITIHLWCNLHATYMLFISLILNINFIKKHKLSLFKFFSPNYVSCRLASVKPCPLIATVT